MARASTRTVFREANLRDKMTNLWNPIGKIANLIFHLMAKEKWYQASVSF